VKALRWGIDHEERLRGPAPRARDRAEPRSRCGAHQSPLALATPGLADGQRFIEPLNPFVVGARDDARDVCSVRPQTMKDKVQWLAAQPMQPRKRQKPCDIGLFENQCRLGQARYAEDRTRGEFSGPRRSITERFRDVAAAPILGRRFLRTGEAEGGSSASLLNQSRSATPQPQIFMEPRS
jgi:hypothetical protein